MAAVCSGWLSLPVCLWLFPGQRGSWIANKGVQVRYPQAPDFGCGMADTFFSRFFFFLSLLPRAPLLPESLDLHTLEAQKLSHLSVVISVRSFMLWGHEFSFLPCKSMDHVLFFSLGHPLAGAC